MRRELRQMATVAERIFWNAVRTQFWDGIKFRRQVSIGPYVVDFYVPSRKLVIELDGDSHYQPNAQRYDEWRDDFLREQGLKVLRFTNTEIQESLDDVIGKIRETIDNTSPAPPHGGGGRNFSSSLRRS